MRLHLLFPMVKIAVLYLVAIKRYSKNTHEHSCSCYQHACERRSIDWEKKNFLKSISKKKKSLAHYFWITLSNWNSNAVKGKLEGLILPPGKISRPGEEFFPSRKVSFSMMVLSHPKQS
jgi:hypothetical protein